MPALKIHDHDCRSLRLRHVFEATKKIFGDARFKNKQLKKIIGVVPDYEKYLAEKVKLQRPYKECADFDMKAGFIEPLLTPQQERHLFAKFNYLKAKARNAAVQGRTTRAEHFLKRALEVKEVIVLANMRMAINVSKHIRSHILDRRVIINECYFQLLRLIESFDWTRKVRNKVKPTQKPHPVKFSTFALSSLQRAMWQITQNIHIKEGRFSLLKGKDSENLEKDVSKQDEVKQEFNKQAVEKLLKFLTERERRIICLRFGIECEPHLLREIADLDGITKEAIRQVEVRALNVMRRAIQNGQLKSSEFDETCIAVA